MTEEKFTPTDLLEMRLLELIEKLSGLDEGSDDWETTTNAILKLYPQWLNARKMEEDSYYRDQENRLKSRQLDLDYRRQRRVKPDTIFMGTLIAGLTIGTCAFEATGHIFPMKRLSFLPKPKFPL